MDVVDKTVQGDTIKSITITRIGQEANNFKVTDESFGKMVEEGKAKVKAADEKRRADEAGAVKNNYPDAVETTDGLKFIIKKEGSGNKPAEGAVVKIRYRGKFLLSGQEFCSTAAEGKPDAVESPESFEYTIGKSKVNPGFDSSAADMKAGELRTVIVPSEKAYGMNAFYAKSVPGKKRFVISPNTTLVYEIELLEIK
jgi:peptidylprolyl isomerase